MEAAHTDTKRNNLSVEWYTTTISVYCTMMYGTYIKYCTISCVWDCCVKVENSKLKRRETHPKTTTNQQKQTTNDKRSLQERKMVKQVNAVKYLTETKHKENQDERRKELHNRANRKWRANLSPERKEAMRKQNRECQRRRRAKKTDKVRAAEREDTVGDSKQARVLRKEISIRQGMGCSVLKEYVTCWWQRHPTVDLDNWANPSKYPPNAYCCSKCRKCYWCKDDALGHEFGIIGDAGIKDKTPSRRRYQERYRYVWINLPCRETSEVPDSVIGVQDKNKDKPLVFPSRYTLERVVPQWQSKSIWHGELRGWEETYHMPLDQAERILKYYQTLNKKNELGTTSQIQFC